MNPAQIAKHLRRANEVARRAAGMGRHPFGALLVAPDDETVLAEQGNIDTVNHAESTLARMAAGNWPGEYLARCTLVTTFEPCAMCAGTLYWANIGRVVYGASEGFAGADRQPRGEPHVVPALPGGAVAWAEVHRGDRAGGGAGG